MKFLVLFLLWVFALSGSILKAETLKQQEETILETHESLKTLPRGAVELMEGSYQSVMLDSPCPFRVFSPVNPQLSVEKVEENILDSNGLRLVVYVMNLDAVQRPSVADDRVIIEDLINDGFLVVTVDFGGAKIVDHLEFQKDINGLFAVFGGEWHTRQSYFTENRQKLLEHPGPNEGLFFTSFPYPGNSSAKKVLVNKSGIYVIPSGYTVEAHRVLRDNLVKAKGGQGVPVTALFMDIIYPKASRSTDKVPMLFEGCSVPSGEFVVNANTPILYSWLFNGYAFGSMSFLKANKGEPIYSVIEGLRYLRSQKDRFSLTGKFGTAGISKSCGRCYYESNFSNENVPLGVEFDDDESSSVQVCMPVVGEYSEEVIENIDENAPPLVLSWCRLNNGKGYKGEIHQKIVDAYEKAGIADKILYLNSPLAGHEYDVYHLNEIMEFFDRHCK